MNRDYFVELFDYNVWANQRVWDCVGQVSQEDFLRPNDFSIGSVYKQVLHWINLERWWIGFLAAGESKFMSKEEIELYQDRDKLRQLWDETNETTMDYVQALTDEELQRKIKAPWWEGENASITVAQALTHVINHGTDHRAQTLAVLHTLGYEGVEQDFIAYLGYV